MQNFTAHRLRVVAEAQSTIELKTAVIFTAVFLASIWDLASRETWGAFARELTAKGLVAIILQDKVTL